MEILAQNIKYSIGDAHILKDVSMKLNNKQFVGIIGPNGSGKSTFLRCVYRVLRPDFGSIQVGGENIFNMSYKESAKKISVVAQHNYYNFDFKIEEVVMMGRSPHKRTLEPDNANDYEIVNKALEKVGMSAFKGRNFSTLSGGEQQRVILARALAQETECIILDEPTNHLDIKYQLQLLDVVRSLNVSVFSAIHDLNIACMYCDYIYVMQAGKVVASGTPKEVLTSELIREIYEVEACVVHDEHKHMHILYYSKEAKN